MIARSFSKSFSFGNRPGRPKDIYAQYVVSQLRFDASDPLKDDTGRIWSVVNGTPAISTLADTPSGPGYSMYFAGNGAIATPHDNAFNIFDKQSVIEFWLKNPSGMAAGTSQQVVYKSGWPYTGSVFLEGNSPQGDSSSGWRFQVQGDGRMDFQPIGGSGGQTVTNPLDFSSWIHVAYTRVSINLGILYINGVKAVQSTSPQTSAIDQAMSLMIGGPRRNNSYLTGYMKDFRFTVGSLRGYTSNFTPPGPLSPL